MKKVILYSAVISLLALASEAGAQYHWQKVHTSYDGVYEFHFNAISCSGDNCILSAILWRNGGTHPIARLYHSSDCGKTWFVSDTEIQDYYDSDNGTPVRTVQQIDAMHAVAAGDSGLFLRTSDGGKSWKRINFADTIGIPSIHFSDSLNGIITINADSGVGSVSITSDGGVTWIKGPTFGDSVWINHCYSYGKGKFRCFGRWGTVSGYIYTTYDNWQHYSVSKPAGGNFDLGSCKFTSEDTIFLIGWSTKINKRFLWRSTPVELFLAWDEINFPYSDLDAVNGVYLLSDLYNDTILSCVNHNGHRNVDTIFRSTDRGTTWHADSIMLDTIFTVSWTKGLAWVNESPGSHNKVPIAIFESDSGYSDDIVARGISSQKAHVETYEYIRFNTFTYPNPASTQLNIITPMPLNKIILFDMLGREALGGITSTEGKISLDISSLPRGVYSIRLNNSGSFITIGKVVAIGK